MKLAIVIPTYNERKTLPTLIERLADQVKHIVDEFNIVIVDDSSPDGTADIAENVNLDLDNFVNIKDFVLEKKIELIICSLEYSSKFESLASIPLKFSKKNFEDNIENR